MNRINNDRGRITLVEVMIVLAIILIISMSVMNIFLNNMTITQKRAEKNLSLYIKKNNIKYTRAGCSGDSDGDGYATCVVKTTKGEKILLKCVGDFMNVDIFGSTACKEEFAPIQLN